MGTQQTTIRPICFSLGHLVATPGALAALVTAGTSPLSFLDRHVTGDYGDLDLDDRRANDADVRRGDGRVLSAYHLADDTKIWIITNLMDGQGYDTCILLPEEY